MNAEVHDERKMPRQKALDLSVETLGRLAEFWGFTRTMGRVFGALFLSPQPLSQAELVEMLGVSAANVSTSLQGLLQWGAVHKVYEKGSRKLLYVAEPEIRKIIRNVVGSRERRELDDATDAFEDARSYLKPRSRDKTESLSEADAFLYRRIEHLESVARISVRMLELLLGAGRLDVNAELNEISKYTEKQSDEENDEARDGEKRVVHPSTDDPAQK